MADQKPPVITRQTAIMGLVGAAVVALVAFFPQFLGACQMAKICAPDATVETTSVGVVDPTPIGK